MNFMYEFNWSCVDNGLIWTNLRMLMNEPIILKYLAIDSMENIVPLTKQQANIVKYNVINISSFDCFTVGILKSTYVYYMHIIYMYIYIIYVYMKILNNRILNYN